MSHATTPALYGLLAEFETATDLVAAAKAAYAAGYRHMDAYSPYPVEEASEAIVNEVGVAVVHRILNVLWYAEIVVGEVGKQRRWGKKVSGWTAAGMTGRTVGFAMEQGEALALLGSELSLSSEHVVELGGKGADLRRSLVGCDR